MDDLRDWLGDVDPIFWLYGGGNTSVSLQVPDLHGDPETESRSWTRSTIVRFDPRSRGSWREAARCG